MTCIAIPRTRQGCWVCGKGIKEGKLHVFRLANRLKLRFVPKGKKGVFNCCTSCLEKIPEERRLSRSANVTVFSATTSGEDGYEATYSSKEMHIGKREFSVTLATARKHLDLKEEYRDDPNWESVKRRRTPALSRPS